MSTLLKGSILIAIGTLYKIVLSLLIDKFLALELGVREYGQYKYGITICILLSSVCTLGFGSSIVRILAINKDRFNKNKIITITLILVSLTSIIVIGIFIIPNAIFQIPLPFILASLFFSLNAIFNGIYSGLEKPRLKVYINDIFGFSFYLLFLWLYFRLNNYVDNIAYVYLIYVFTVFIVNVLSVKKYYQRFNKKDFLSKEIKGYFNYTWPLFGVSILIMLSTHLDKLILDLYVTEEQLSVYYAVFNISNLIPLILTIFLFLYLPRISKYFINGKIKTAILVNSYSSKWTMIMASAFLLIILFYTKSLLALLYSKDFVKGYYILQLLAIGQWINVSLGFTGQNLLALGDSKSQMYIRLLSFAIGTIVLCFGVVFYGNLGAAMAILFGLLCSNAMQIYVLKKKHNFFGYKLQNLYALVVLIFIGFTIGCFHKLIDFRELNMFLAISIDLIVFLALLILLKVLNKKDVKILKIID